MMLKEKRGRERGFTLAELAIVVAVVGILLGATIIPMRALEEKRQLQEEMHRMEEVRDAVIGYAIRHRTRERIVKFIPWFGPRREWAFRLPGGRPYLPCPDFDGDGFEDRVPKGSDGFMQGLEVKPDLTVTITVGSYQGENSMAWMTDGVFNYGTHPYGECQTSRGTVPWRTLGVEPSDGWGNRHTYFADPVFSNAIFGFDRQTIADIYDGRVPKAPGFPLAERGFKEVDGIRILPDHLTAPPERGVRWPESDAGCPAAICDSDNCAPYHYAVAETGTIRRCAWRTPPGRRIFKAGGVTPEEIFPVSPGGKYFPANTVTDGLPFVLVSHGPNGRFAVNHWGTLNSPGNGPVCNLAWAGFLGESRITRIPAGDDAVLYEAVNGARVSSIINAPHCTALSGEDGRGLHFTFNMSHFVWRPPGTGDKSGFDDLLLWMTRDELSVAIPGRIPPLPPMVIGYFP